jgi:hypothetical protein
MRKVRVSIVAVVAALALVGCLPGGMRSSPAGSYKFGSIAMQLDGGGTFAITQTASTQDNRNYTVSGTYAYTLEHTDTYNEITYGHIDLTVSGITLNGSSVTGLDVTSFYVGNDFGISSVLPGWWEFMVNASGGPELDLKMNVPASGGRQVDPFSGSDWLLEGYVY